MVRTVYALLLFCAVAGGLNLWAQQKSAAKPGAHKLLMPTVYLGDSKYKGGPIKREEFNRLLKQGLTSKDSVGNRYKVMGFDFNYAEAQLYEDSIGNPKVMMDFSFEYCPGDTITRNVSSSIYDRIKPGDTVYISNVRVVKYLNKTKLAPDSTAFLAKGLKCEIIK